MRLLDPAACPVEPESRAFTNAALAELRTRHWAPRGWAAFGRSVAVRSFEQLALHPRAALELTLLHCAFTAAGRGRRRWWVASSWFLAITHLGLLGQRRSLGWANTISLARANLPAVAEPLGPWVGVVAVVSDKLDGAIARRTAPTMFGYYTDSLADAAFWSWLAAHHEPSRCLRAATVAAWALPVASVTAASIATGEMVAAPRPSLLRPAAAMQAVLAIRVLREPQTGDGRHGGRDRAERSTRIRGGSGRGNRVDDRRSLRDRSE